MHETAIPPRPPTSTITVAVFKEINSKTKYNKHIISHKAFDALDFLNPTIKHGQIYLIIFAIACLFGCAEKPNRVYFTINHADKIVIPLQLNDSVTAKLTFDTGGDFCLDSTFFANNLHVSNYGSTATKQEGGSAWSDQRVDGN